MTLGGIRIATTTLAVLAAAALSGCGGTGASTGTTVLSSVEPSTVSLRSSAVHGSTLPALYTCDGRDISPPLSWGALPSGVKEVALFVLGVRRGKAGRPVASIEWALAGVKPQLQGLRAGDVPPGAFALAASDGSRRYSVCPASGQTERYTFALYAMPRGVRASPALAGTALLLNLTQSGVPQNEAPASGTFSVTYKRRR